MAVASIKPGVRIDRLTPRMALAWAMIQPLFLDRGFDCVLTTGEDGKHMQGSKHYDGDAFDIRARDIKDLSVRAGIRAEMARNLGENFDVVLHAPSERSPGHFHVEYDPDWKKGKDNG